MEQLKTLAEGADYCDFRYSLKQWNIYKIKKCQIKKCQI